MPMLKPAGGDTRSDETSITAALAVADRWRDRGRWDDAAALLRAIRPLVRERAPDREPEVLVELVRVLNAQDFLQGYRNGAEVRTLLGELDAAADATADPRLRGAVLHERAVHLHLRYFTDGGDPERERELLDEAIEVRRAAGDRRGEAMSTFYRGCVDHVIHADSASGERWFRTVLRMGAELEDAVVQSYAERHLGQIEQERGDLDGALERLSASLRLREEAGWYAGTAPALIALAEIHRVRGERSQALSALRRGRAVARELGAPFLYEIACTEYELLAAGSRAGGANVRVVVGPQADDRSGFEPSAGPQGLSGAGERT
jgi:tetratricopeptide (TPR) repeat protein